MVDLVDQETPLLFAADPGQGADFISYTVNAPVNIEGGDGFDPLLMEVNTATEYWQKGASLIHTDAGLGRDLKLPDNSRAYLIAGTQHTVGTANVRAYCNLLLATGNVGKFDIFVNVCGGGPSIVRRATGRRP